MDGKEVVTMSMQEVDRLKVICEALKGKLSKRQAAAQLGLSKRQIIRICKRVKKEGNRGIVHRLRGGGSNHSLDPAVVEQAVAIVSKEYADFGPTYANEKLRQKHDIKISTNTLRKLMIQEGLWKARRPKQRHRSCRQRRECVGEMVQLDGSEHDWFEGRGARCVLLIYIDDATSRILFGKFVPSESTIELLQSTKTYLETYGRPLAFYVDKDSIYRINRQASIEEQLRDLQPMTQFGRAMEELGIQVICAHSPQAKGRVERSFKTHQDRLVKELRIHGISNPEDANQFLQRIYIPAHNARFAVPPANPTAAHRPLLKQHQLEEILSLRTERTVGNDFTVRFQNRFFQILPVETLRVCSKDKLLVETRLDGSLHLRHKGQYLAFKEIAKPAPVSQTEKIMKPRKPTIPAKDHPWRIFPFLRQAGVPKIKEATPQDNS